MLYQELADFANGLVRSTAASRYPTTTNMPVSQFDDYGLSNSSSDLDDPGDLAFSIPAQPEGQLLKYVPLLEDFYPEYEDGLKDCAEPQEVDDSIKDM